ncbi:DUF1367 family protein [Sphingomonas montanisoli]|uniref:DUF1367 family protein n=1 Tax=Sphingomonas montanisoli TaxID=2606412 RepID=A0A5D9C6L2_9SPHN|nr:DUF1367 family protein [Sphingomonas montanisoli]TZG25625.1 DUF1367 family protein [Sphingomonas montanisoli]
MASLAPYHFRKTLSGFEPVSAAARDFHAKTKLGQTVQLTGRRPRNPGHHRKFFALLGILVDNTDQFASTEDALIAVKAATGHGVWKKLHPKADREIFIPHSIDFASMPQDEFEAFYNLAFAAIIRWWLPVAANDLREAVESFAA